MNIDLEEIRKRNERLYGDVHNFVAVYGWGEAPGVARSGAEVDALARQASADIDALTAEVDRLLRMQDAAITRLQAEADRHERMRDWYREAWLRDIVADLNVGR